MEYSSERRMGGPLILGILVERLDWTCGSMATRLQVAETMHNLTGSAFEEDCAAVVEDDAEPTMTLSTEGTAGDWFIDTKGNGDDDGARELSTVGDMNSNKGEVESTSGIDEIMANAIRLYPSTMSKRIFFGAVCAIS